MELADHLLLIETTNRGDNGGAIWRCTCATNVAAAECFKWVGLQRSAITPEALRNNITSLACDVDEAGLERARTSSNKLYLMLFDTCKGERHDMEEEGGHGDVMEAWRTPLHR